MHHRRAFAFATTAALLLSAAAHAARPQSWTFAAQKDYVEGRFDNIVVDSYGQLTLGRTLTPIPVEHAGESVQGFAQTPDGALYVATSPSAKVFRIKDGKTEVVYSAPKGFDDITAIAGDAKGNLLIALSGESAKLVSLNPTGDKAAPTTRFENKDVDYIWAITPAADGTIYLGTGPHGKVYKLADGAEAEVLLETGQKNVTALTLDKSNNVIAGTDAHGLVIRVDAVTKKPFVLLDAGKLDVNALVSDADGNLYVATAKAQFTDQNSKEAGAPGAGDSMDEPDSRSKPDAPEKEPIEPPTDDGAKTPATQGAGPIAPGFRLFLGAAGSDLPPDLKAMLKKAANKPSPLAHSSKNKSDTLPTHASRMHSKAMSLDETPSPDDVSGVTRISPDGLATTLVQDQGDNYSLLLAGDELLIGTGDEGKLYSYHLHDESLALIARVKEQQISNLFADKTGNIFLGTGNMAEIYQLGADLAPKGSFTSQVLDASHTASWGHALIDSTAHETNHVLIESRSGNTQDVQANAKFWSDWMPAGEGSKIASPAARFLQFRITLSTDGKSGTPTVSNLRLAYQTQNLAPKIKSVSLDLPGMASSDGSADPDSMTGTDDTSPPPAEKLSHISWDAADPNGDTLLYRVYYKQITPEGKDPWTLLARDLKDAVYEWDTRTIPDGKYQVKVVASDSPDNPAPDALESARSSIPFLINHTPPTLSDLAPTLDGNKATITGSAKDALSPVTDVRYQVDGQISGGDWQPAAASDKIFDSPQEAFTLVTRPLSAGPHRITIRATDAAGNSSYKAVTITVKP